MFFYKGVWSCGVNTEGKSRSFIIWINMCGYRSHFNTRCKLGDKHMLGCLLVLYLIHTDSNFHIPPSPHYTTVLKLSQFHLNYNFPWQLTCKMS